jgi:NTE family protein
MREVIPISIRTLAKRILVFTFILLGFNCFSFQLAAQKTPKIGLVLSGGGAKGMAHIGILKALEEAGITPDFITGTSMGSIMGGLYSIGYTADELKEIALTADWDQLLSNKLKLNEVAYEEKDYYGRYITDLTISGSKFELPKGLIEGQKLSMTLSTLTRGVMNINDFNDFPIPFACIAADIENGNKVVLNKGSLARSIRASMAIPTVFTPVVIDDHLLVDGGLVHNFPVEESIEMGADYVIGVYVGTDLLKKEEMTSPFNVLTQSAFILSAIDNDVQKKLVNFYIEPDLTGYSTKDFNKAAEIIAIGEECGKKLVEKFRALNDSLTKAGRVNKIIEKPRMKDSVYISEIRILNNKVIHSAFIRDRLGIKEKSTISVINLENAITHLYGTGFFTKILYELKDSEKGKILVIDVSESPEGKLRVALQYDRETGVALLLNLTYRNLLLNSSRITVEGEISENPILDINYLKYFGEGQKWGFGTGYFMRNAEVPDIKENAIDALLEYNYNKYFASIASLHKRNMIVQLSYFYETASLKPKIAPNELRIIDKLKFNANSFELLVDFNNLDDRYFPKHGNNLGARIKYSTNSSLTIHLNQIDTIPKSEFKETDYGSFSNSFFQKSVISVGNKVTFGMQNTLNFNLMDRDQSAVVSTGFINDSYIGGFRKIAPNDMPFWGAQPLRYYAENVFFNELMFQLEFKRNLFFQVLSQYYLANPMGFIFSTVKEGRYDLGGDNYIIGVGASLAYRSPMGPISISIAKGNSGTELMYNFNLGFYFDRN